jgi:hypothetical protein
MLYVCVCVCIYVYMYVCVCVCVYIYIVATVRTEHRLEQNLTRIGSSGTITTE